MTAALELADAGTPVTLIEQAATLADQAVTQDPESVAGLTTAVQAHTGITTRLSSRIVHVDGSIGGYRISIENHDPLPETLVEAQCGPFGAIIVATGPPDHETTKLARLLRLPQDAEGFLPEFRVRLRPEDYVERGIYVCGSVHYPCDPAEARFQAYSAASRALRHLRRGKVISLGPVAQVDPEKCNGCADCLTVCPFAAVTMVERQTGLSLSHIDPLLCAGCGNCVAVCPVGAVTVAGWTDAQLEVQMHTALLGVSNTGNSVEGGGDRSRVLVFACEWSGYAAAELAGAQKLSYPPNVRIIRLDCAGRLQPGLVLKAFELGAAGVLVLGCEPKLCHYERGSEQAAAAYEQVEAVAGLLGLAPSRLQLAWTPPDDGPAFAELVTCFAKGVESPESGEGERSAQHTEHAIRSTQYAIRNTK
jgi:heterodisulfide reductase subunit A